MFLLHKLTLSDRHLIAATHFLFCTRLVPRLQHRTEVAPRKCGPQYWLGHSFCFFRRGRGLALRLGSLARTPLSLITRTKKRKGISKDQKDAFSSANSSQLHDLINFWFFASNIITTLPNWLVTPKAHLLDAGAGVRMNSPE